MILDNMSDIHIDSNYGDFVFKGDLQTIEDRQVLKHLINERVKTSFGDFRLNIESGADVERFVGAAITDQLIDDIKASIQNSLTYDGLLPPQDITIAPLKVGNNRVYFRIMITDPYSKDTITTSTLYNSEVIYND